jgi:hypothetical protein
MIRIFIDVLSRVEKTILPIVGDYRCGRPDLSNRAESSGQSTVLRIPGWDHLSVDEDETAAECKLDGT